MTKIGGFPGFFDIGKEARLIFTRSDFLSKRVFFRI